MRKSFKILSILLIAFLSTCFLPPVEDTTTEENEDNNIIEVGEIEITESFISISNQGSVSYSSVEIGDSRVKTYTIKNSGNGDLKLTGSPIVAVSGTNAALFTITQPSFNSISPNSSVSFTVTYTPTGDPGTHTAILSIANDDSDESNYSFTLTGTSTLTASSIDVTVSQNNIQDTIENGSSNVSISVTVKNNFDIIATNYTGDINLSLDSDFSITPATITISTDGTATGLFTISKDPLPEDTVVILTASGTSLTSKTKNISVKMVLIGSPLSDSDFSSGYTITVGSYHIAPRETTDSTINVGGNIIIGAGTKLVIYPGVTLNMGSNQITIEGDLIIYGTDNKRVKLSSTGSWIGIVSGNSSGTSSIDIDGAVIEKTNSYPLKIGTTSTNRSGSVKISNSRIKVDGGAREAFYVLYPKGGSTYSFKHNIIISQDQEAFYFANNSDSSITVDIVGNTIIGNPSGSASVGINITESSATSTYTIDNNIIAGSYSDALYFSSTNIYVYYRNNVIKAGSKYLSMVSGGNVEQSNNFYKDGDVTTTDTSAIPLNESDLFVNPALLDFNLKQTLEFPSTSQVINIADKTKIVGSLTTGHANEKGAYSNNGYPPNENE